MAPLPEATSGRRIPSITAAIKRSTVLARIGHINVMDLAGIPIGRLSARRAIAWSVLALVMLRAAIPVGFMPDLDALADGRIEIVICTPGGLKTIAVPADGAAATGAEERSSSDAAAYECPFDAVVSQAVLLADPAPDLRRVLEPAESRQSLERETLVARYSGPPLGSRAPPV
ncbi:DUF2946 family protein [Thalassobaculum sp.]|uniref:DUF2946 family protein n=1 Tax=Thalassobaculum sp. TaxID=2022740 RepID=UPI003B5AAAEE